MSLNCFRAKLKTIRKTKEDKEHIVAEEEVKPAPEEMLSEEEEEETAGAL